MRQVLPIVSLAAACLNGSALTLALSLAGTGAAFLPRVLGVLRFRQPLDGAAASSNWNLCAPGNPVVCLFSLDGAVTCYLEGSGVFSRGREVKLLVTLFGLAGLGLAAASPPKQLSDFGLSDQNSVFRRCGFPKQKVTVMTVADREGSEQLEPWITNL